MGIDLSLDKRRDGSWLMFFMALLCIVPFLSIWRVGPLSSFYLEAGSLLFAVLLILQTASAFLFGHKLPRASVYFFALAAFWWVQARLMDLPYLGQSDQAVWTFGVLALLAWGLHGWVRHIGKDEVVRVLALALCVGATLQAVVCWLQFTGWVSHFDGILAYGHAKAINGQLGQRNHLGHYLMWGVLAAAYLWGERKLPAWAGLPLIVFLTTTLGLVNSRTILLYVVAVGAVLLLWRLRSVRQGNRLFLITLFALVMVVAVQFSLNSVLAWFGDVQVETALARVENSSFSGSARDLEWTKAWQVFQLAPIFGHGWGSFSWQGFWHSSFPQGYSPSGLSVLFTHSHNIVLQLLAEMGVVGTLLVFGGAAWVALPALRKKKLAGNAFLPSALLAVSLCHSMLEYPLWYVYFLTPVAMMLSLAGEQDETADGIAEPFHASSLLSLAMLGAAVVLVAGIVRLGLVYHDLSKFDARVKSDSVQVVQDKIAGLRKISQHEPLLAYYADLSLTRRASPTDKELQEWAIAATSKAMQYRPYATAYQWALYQYRLGQKDEAQQWLAKLYRYYPNMLPFYANQMRNSPYFSPLLPQALQSCAEFNAIRPNSKKCVP
ncbi:MAG: Wzy polymerase domain-containing protein [Neisseria sp.]|nr:Wzy polymerase domain-containing protein [Neisseria sp.]